MTKRHIHYEAAFEDFIRSRRVPYVAVDEARRRDVKVIRQEWTGHPWSCRSAEAWLSVPDPVKIADFHEVAVSVADMSRTTHAQAEQVDDEFPVERADRLDQPHVDPQDERHRPAGDPRHDVGAAHAQPARHQPRRLGPPRPPGNVLVLVLGMETAHGNIISLTRVDLDGAIRLAL